MTFKPKSITVQMHDESVELREISVKAFKEILAMDSTQQNDALLLKSVYANGEPLFKSVDEVNEITIDAYALLIQETLKLNRIGEQKKT